MVLFPLCVLIEKYLNLFPESTINRPDSLNFHEKYGAILHKKQRQQTS
jgi:hypothetical protein